MMVAYYNENDPFCAQWLRNLIAAGHIAPGDVDERDIRDVRPHELRAFAQCHFFAGTGVWSYALRLAGWPDDRPVWTGSCPCQPFSMAGRRGGISDERHLWPHWYRLVEQCRPSVIFGEQVASKDALQWLDLVSDDLEGAGYAIGAADLCAAGVGAPHIRQRLYWMACAECTDNERICRSVEASGVSGKTGTKTQERQRSRPPASPGSTSGGVAHPDGAGSQGWLCTELCRRPGGYAGPGGASGGMADSGLPGQHEWLSSREQPTRDQHSAPVSAGPTDPLDGFWEDADWLFCRDGKWRSAEPGTFPLAHGAPFRMGRLRGYGNAIVAPLAAEFIKAAKEIIDARR